MTRVLGSQWPSDPTMPMREREQHAKRDAHRAKGAARHGGGGGGDRYREHEEDPAAQHARRHGPCRQ